MNPKAPFQSHDVTRATRLAACFACLLLTAVSSSTQGQSTARLVPVRQVESPPPAASPSAETFRLAGKVVDGEGRPVAGAVLEAYAGANSPVQVADMELKQRLTTGADGGFNLVLPRGAVEVLVRKAGLAPTWWTQWNQPWSNAQDTENETLVLSQPSVLAGTVVDDADKPVADAEVRVSTAYLERSMGNGSTGYAYLHGKPAREVFSARTTAEGKFRIENFPAGGSADLDVTKSGKVLRPISRQYISPDTLFHPADADIKLVLDPAGSIAGKVVVQETGKPLAGARFSLTQNQPGYRPAHSPEAVSSGADGTFVLPDLAPGNYMLRATIGTNAVPDWVAEPVAVTVEAGKTVREVQIAAVPGGFLKAVVLGKENMSFVAKASIQVSQGAYQASAITDTNGAALFRLPAGSYRVFASRGEARAEGVSLSVESGQTNRHEFLLNPPPRLVGTVRDPAGQPARGLPVQVIGSFNASGTDIKTDEQGHFEIPFNPQRFSGMNVTPCVVVRDVPHNLVASEDIEDHQKPLELKLEPGLVVTGRVEDPNGKPLTNATIQIFLWVGNMGTQFEPQRPRADPQGRFEVSALPADRRYSMAAEAKGYGSTSQSVQREDSATNRVELAAFVLQPADHQIAGLVVDADDKPVSGARVYMYGQGQPNTSVRTDAKGHFKFDTVCEGTVQLSASAREAHGSTSAQADATNVVLQLGVQQSRGIREITPPRTALKGQRLPDLSTVHLSGDACPTDKPVLLCLFDSEQRPSRRVLNALAQQHEALKQQGLAVLAVQAPVTTAAAFKEWKDASAVAFPVGYVSEKSDKTRWAAGIETLPWLILTDKEHRVIAEGFSLEELDTQLKALTK